ncbi:DUF2254 domain-containing protein [uncultured Jatrophihabitans sp.]|uniref:DUF2254 domain-containing protein n=1 Tax=uncultured Jatrophihabitans sp. TaxID=1610747 RepID=UPI0035CA521F
MRAVTFGLSPWRREALRTTLWVVPVALLLAAVALFVVTYNVDYHVYNRGTVLPSWIRLESADGARQLLSALAAGVITVLGVVFSVTIVALTLASQQFGPRMLRNFIRDFGTQATLGTFVATFVYSVLTLGAIGGGSTAQTFVPQISVTVALILVLVNVLVLIYFIHHITVSIQLPVVISSIAGNLSRAIDVQFPVASQPPARRVFATGRSAEQLRELLAGEGFPVVATKSGYLQFVGYERLVRIATKHDVVLQVMHRPGHFVTHGLPLARVWPPSDAREVLASLENAHITGPHRTLDQDPVFAIDQLVEIAIRALSPAVNDTFTALTCIDWLADGLCTASERDLPDGVHRDSAGAIRVIGLGPSYRRMVDRSYDKIRQAGAAMPAVAIRLMESLGKVFAYTQSSEQRAVLLRQADMILRGSAAGIDEDEDRSEVRRRYDLLVTELDRLDVSHRST